MVAGCRWCCMQQLQTVSGRALGSWGKLKGREEEGKEAWLLPRCWAVEERPKSQATVRVASAIEGGGRSGG